MDIWCHFVIALLVIHLPVILAEGCDDGWEENGDMCYYFSYNITTSRNDAQSRCIGKGGVLASAANKDINDYLHSQMTINSIGDGNKHHWIGLVGTDEPHITSNWRWLDGSVVHDISWFPGEPSSEQTVCGKIGRDGTTDLALANRECKSQIGYICEATTDHTNQGWTEYGSHWYVFLDNGTTNNFIQAFNECISLNAKLATIETREELTFIRNRTGKSQQYWIGLTTLHWLDHSPITYTNFWDVKELNVNNPGVYLHTSQNKWASESSEDKRFICQKAKPTTSTSTTVTTTSSTTTSTSTMTNQTTPSLTPSTSTTQPEPQNDTVVSDTDDNVHMTTESRSPSNTVGNNGITEKIQMDKDKMPMIAGIVAGIVIAIIVVVVIVILLYRRRKSSHSKAEIAHVDDNGNRAPTEDSIEPYGTSAILVVDNDMQPYGTSEIQPYGTSDMKTIEDNALNHKYESEGVFPLYNDVHINDKKRAVTPPDVKQQIPEYAVVNKPKDKLDPNSSKGGSEDPTQSYGKSSCDDDSLTINININNMPVYAVVDITKKKPSNAKEGSAEQRNCISADDANTPIVETNKNETFADDSLPVYSVVDKTKKNAAYVPKQIRDQQNQSEKQNTNRIRVPTDGPIYAVVDQNKKVQSPKPIPPVKPSAIQTQNSDIDDTCTHLYSECENINNTVGYAEFDIQDGAEETNTFSVDVDNDYEEVQFKA